jgi:hypothetical protein
MRRDNRANHLSLRLVALAAAACSAWGCSLMPTSSSESPAPLRMPSPKLLGQGETYEQSLTGGQIFNMYCSACHNFRSLAERPFSSYQNVAAHMRTRANLTDMEYEKLVDFMRRFHDVPAPNPRVSPSPTRPVFSQPISELREDADQAGERPGNAGAAPGN